MKTRIIQTRFWDDEFVSELDVDSKLVFLYILTNDSVGMTGIYEKPIPFISFFCGIPKQRVEKALENISPKVEYDNGWVIIKNAIKYNNYAANSKQRMAYMREWEKLPDRLKHYVPYFDSVDSYKPKYKRTNSSNQHRNIAEKILGRKLNEDEVVHHIDKNPSNNSPDNLAVMSSNTHTILHQGKTDLHDSSIILLSEYYHSTPKTEIRNKKTEIRNKKTEIRKEASFLKKSENDLKEILNFYNEIFGKNITSTKGFEKNYLEYWKDVHDLETTKKAILNARNDKYWHNVMDLTILFRRKNRNGENVDHIQNLSQRTQINNAGTSVGNIQFL